MFQNKTTKIMLIILGFLVIIVLGLFLYGHSVSSPNPKKPATDYLTEGQKLLDSHQYDQAVKTLEEAIKKYPDDLQFKSSLAQAYCGVKNYDGAIKQYEDINQLQETAVSLNNLANVYRDKGDIEKAKELYRKAIEKDPKLSSAYLNLATLLNAEGKYDDSIALLEEGKKAGIESSIISVLASTYVKKGDKKTAKQILNQWLSKNPDDQSAKKLLEEIQ